MLKEFRFQWSDAFGKIDIGIDTILETGLNGETFLLEENTRIKDFISRYPWTFAKTYATFAPHEYYVKDRLDKKGQEDFVWFVEYIRENGFACMFAGKMHTYYEFNGHYYWTMGDRIEETIILNRCKVEDYTIKDGSMYFSK